MELDSQIVLQPCFIPIVLITDSLKKIEGVSGTLAVEWLLEVREQKPPWNELCSRCRKGYRNRLGCEIMQLNVRWARILCAGSRFLHMWEQDGAKPILRDVTSA